MPIGIQFENIVAQLRLFGPEIVHKADRPLDNVSQLARSLVGPLQNDSGTLQVIPGKQIGGVHFCSFQNGIVETAVRFGA